MNYVQQYIATGRLDKVFVDYVTPNPTKRITLPLTLQKRITLPLTLQKGSHSKSQGTSAHWPPDISGIRFYYDIYSSWISWIYRDKHGTFVCFVKW